MGYKDKSKALRSDCGEGGVRRVGWGDIVVPAVEVVSRWVCPGDRDLKMVDVDVDVDVGGG